MMIVVFDRQAHDRVAFGKNQEDSPSAPADPGAGTSGQDAGGWP